MIFYLFLSLLTAFANELEPVQVHGSMSASKVELNSYSSCVKVLINYGGHGSGTLISIGKYKFVLTAKHVVENVPIQAIEIDGRIVGSRTVYNHLLSDIAVLWVDPKEDWVPDGIKWKTESKIFPGQEIVLTSFPGNSIKSLTHGNVASDKPDESGEILIYSNSWPGSSGGAVFSPRGRIIGVVTGILVEANPLDISKLVILENTVSIAPVHDISERDILKGVQSIIDEYTEKD